MWTENHVQCTIFATLNQTAYCSILYATHSPTPVNKPACAAFHVFVCIKCSLTRACTGAVIYLFIYFLLFLQHYYYIFPLTPD